MLSKKSSLHSAKAGPYTPHKRRNLKTSAESAKAAWKTTNRFSKKTIQIKKPDLEETFLIWLY
jgi:hypothetical protein